MVCLQFKQYQALLSKQNKDTATREPLNQPVYKLTWLFLVDKSINHLLVSQMASYHAHLGGNNGLLGKSMGGINNRFHCQNKCFK